MKFIACFAFVFCLFTLSAHAKKHHSAVFIASPNDYPLPGYDRILTKRLEWKNNSLWAIISTGNTSFSSRYSPENQFYKFSFPGVVMNSDGTLNATTKQGRVIMVAAQQGNEIVPAPAAIIYLIHMKGRLQAVLTTTKEGNPVSVHWKTLISKAWSMNNLIPGL